MKETLSLIQATAICNEINAIMMQCKVRMEIKNRQFSEAVAKIWEDNNAVECFKKHKQNMEEAIKTLDHNNKIFVRMVQSIANNYSKVGGMDKLEVNEINLVPNIDVSCVKPHFSDGNGDDFGFVNPKSGAQQVMDAFEQLEKELTKIAEETKTRINSINAFGNPQVQSEIAHSSKVVVEILNEHVESARKIMQDYLDKTAQAYVATGENAKDTINDLNGVDVPPQTAPVPPRPVGPGDAPTTGPVAPGGNALSVESGHGPGGHAPSGGSGHGPGGHAPSVGSGHGPGGNAPSGGSGHGPGGHAPSGGSGHGPGGHAPSGGYGPGGHAPSGGSGYSGGGSYAGSAEGSYYGK